MEMYYKNRLTSYVLLIIKLNIYKQCIEVKTQNYQPHMIHGNELINLLKTKMFKLKNMNLEITFKILKIEKNERAHTHIRMIHITQP